MKGTLLHASVLAILATALSGCLEIETTTRIHPDGRLTRTVAVSGDSSDFSNFRMGLFGLDSGWTVVSDSTLRERERKLTLQRDFDDAAAASRTLAGIPLQRQGITLRLEKKFRWFTSLYRYEETWQRGYQFTRVPMSAYLSPDEIQMALAGDLEGPDSLLTEGEKRHRADLEKRGDEWFNRNSFEEIFQAVLEGARSVNDPRLTPDTLLAAKDRLYAACAGHFKPPLTSSGQLVGAFATVLTTPALPRAIEEARPSLERHDRAVKFMEELQAPGYAVGVVMPGIITGTNGSSVEGNMVKWKDVKNHAFYEDYTLWAESSMVNWWAVVMTAIILAAIGALLVAGLVKKR
jgi:hypothetical protein